MRGFLKLPKEPITTEPVTMSRHGSTTSVSASPVRHTSALVKGTSPAGYKQINQYIVIKTIGKGVHGKVCMGKAPSSSDDLFVAIKVIPKNKKGQLNNNNYLSLIKKEIAIMKKMNHPNVVRLIEVIEDPFDENVYLVMEYCYGQIKWRKKTVNSPLPDNKADTSEFTTIFKSNSFSHSNSSDDDLSLNSPVLWSDKDGIEEDNRLEPHREMYQWSDKQSSSQFYIGDTTSSEGSIPIGFQPVLNEQQSRYIIKQVINGLEYLHYQGVIHRDIKPANLLYTWVLKDNEKQLQVKITDFGVSHFSNKSSLNDPELEKTVGSPAFFAPELCVATDENHLPIKYEDEPHPLLDDPDYKVYITKSIDIWALGVTLYCMIYGTVPFSASNEYELLDIIPKQPLDLPNGPSDKCKDLLRRLLEKRWDKRITLSGLKQHPWIIDDMTEQQVQQWLTETNPSQYDVIEVSQNEVDNAVTIMDKLRKSVRRLSSSFSNMVVDLKKVMSRRGILLLI